MNTEYKGYTIKIEHDEYLFDPRDNSNIGKMICFHGRYSLGDRHDYKHKDYSSWEELEKQLIKDFRNDLILPLYLYDHSGITMNTTGFGCRWDSGQVGFIIVDREGLKECCGINRITKLNKDKILQWLEGEVEAYDRYIRGECYLYNILDEDGEEVESCRGYDDEEDCLEEAKGVIDYMVKNTEKACI